MKGSFMSNLQPSLKEKSIQHVNGISLGESISESGICRSCAIGKQRRVPRKLSATDISERKPIERFFMDVIGPIALPSLMNSRYFRKIFWMNTVDPILFDF